MDLSQGTGVPGRRVPWGTWERDRGVRVGARQGSGLPQAPESWADSDCSGIQGPTPPVQRLVVVVGGPYSSQSPGQVQLSIVGQNLTGATLSTESQQEAHLGGRQRHRGCEEAALGLMEWVGVEPQIRKTGESRKMQNQSSETQERRPRGAPPHHWDDGGWGGGTSRAQAPRQSPHIKG